MTPSLTPHAESWELPIETDDPWGTAILYWTDETGSSFRLESYGEDGLDSGPDVGGTRDFRHDLVIVDGRLVCYPAWPHRH